MNEADTSNISKLAKNSLITASGSIFSMIVLPVVSILTARVLRAEMYGIYSIVQSWSSFLANLSGLGFQGMNLRFIPTYAGNGDYAKAKGSILWTLKVAGCVSGAVALFIFLFPGLFCALFINRPETISQEIFDKNVVGAFRFFSISVFITSVYLVFQSSLNGLKAIKYKVLSNDVIGSVVKISSLLLLFFLGLDLYAVLASSLLQDVAILVTSFVFLAKVFPQIKEPAFLPVYEKKEMNKFAATLFANSLLSKYTFQLDILFLGYFNTMREVGIYTIALRLQPLIYLPHYSVMTIFGPVTAELYAAGKMGELERLFKTVTKWTFSVCLPIFATIILFAKEILNVFGKEFMAGFSIIIILSIGNLIHDLLGMAGNVIMMSGRIKVNLINSACMAFLNVILFYFLIKSYGITGAAVGNAVSTMVMSILTACEVYYIFHFHPFTKSLFKPVLSIIIAGTLTYYLKYYIRIDYYGFFFVLYILLMILMYIVILYFMRLDETDRYVINKIVRRFSFLKKFTKG